MPNRTAQRIEFGRVGRRVVEANFDGGDLSSDGGLMLLRRVDERIGLTRAVAAVFSDARDPARITHRLRAIALASAELARVTAATIRVRLLKIGAAIVRNTRRMRILLASHHPLRAVFLRAARALAP